MIIKSLLDEDFVNYKKPSMFIAFPRCSFKCEKEGGVNCCQNSDLVKSPNLYVDAESIVERYLQNPITKAIVLGGLEPFDSWPDLFDIVILFREKTDNDIVIYTGYNKNEIQEEINILSKYKNIIVKFGRFIPDNKEKYDDVLGIKLKSENQYAELISEVNQ